MPSLTRWTRLEPVTRDASLRAALAGRVYDPLWMLGRQWQLGEFKGEDAGSPIVTRLRVDVAPLTRYRPSSAPIDAPSAEYSPATMPVETIAEGDGIRRNGAATVFDRAEAGLHLLRMLDARGVTPATRQAFITRFSLLAPADPTLDAEARGYVTLVAGRLPDGVAVYERLKASGSAPSVDSLPDGVDAGDRDAALQVLRDWMAWYETLFIEPGAGAEAWKPERMEYEFSVAARTADGELVLHAPEFRGGRADWDSFDVDPQQTLGAPDALRQESVSVLPAPASFRGMSASRWWELEDARVDLGAVEVEPEDLSRLLLIEFAISSGDDWFVVPIEVPRGSICAIRSLIVADTFGVRTLVPPYRTAQSASGGVWRLWSLTREEDASQAPFLLVPPALASTIDGTPLEEVRFVRDEVANIAWAIERTVAGEDGRPADRFRAYQEAERRRLDGTSPAQPGPDDPLWYRLQSSIPDYWIPLLPEKDERGVARLRRGAMRTSDGSPIQPRGRILADGTRPTAWVYDEEVPRSGWRVVRRCRYARVAGGGTVVWSARQKAAGAGEGSSGLRFDAVDAAPGQPTP